MARSKLKDFSRSSKSAESEGPMAGIVIDTEPTAVEEVKTKQDDALRIVKKNMYWTMGISLAPLPLVDLAGVAGFQAVALKELSDLYGVPFTRHKFKNVAAILISSLGTLYLGKILAGSSLKSIPLLGTIASATAVPAVAGALSYAIGKVFIQNLESGGTFLDLDPEAVREYFRAQFEEGLQMASRTAETG